MKESAAPTAGIRVQGLTLTLSRDEILSGVSLEARQGEVLGILGPSGSGKSTLLRAVMGLVPPDRGRVWIQDRLVSGPGEILVPPEARDLGVVFQELALWPHMTVGQNLSFGLRGRGLQRSETEHRVARALREVGLEDAVDRYPHQLSGGERQRVAIARALVLRPAAILMDEPLSNLDVVLRGELIDLMARLFEARSPRPTVLYVTHDPREALALTDRVAILDHGEVAYQGPWDDLPKEHPSRFVTLLGSSS